MSILSRTAKVLRGELAPTASRTFAESPDGPEVAEASPRSRGAKSRVRETDFAWAGTEEAPGLVFVRRIPAFPAEVWALWKDGEAPRYLEFLDGVYRLGADAGKRIFYLVEPRPKPAWLFDEVRLPGDPVDSSLVCYECGRRLFWRDVDGVERCSLCRPPRFDRMHAAKSGGWKFEQGFAEQFSGWFLKPGLDGAGREVL
jgi:hypothetical protein